MSNTAPHPEQHGVPELSLADRLVIARRKTRLDVREFAEHIGISRSTVSNYENEDYARRRKPLYLKAWAIGSGVDYTWLATGQTDQAPGGPEGASDLRPNGFACTTDPRQGGLASVIKLTPHAA